MTNEAAILALFIATSLRHPGRWQRLPEKEKSVDRPPRSASNDLLKTKGGLLLACQRLRPNAIRPPYALSKSV